MDVYKIGVALAVSSNGAQVLGALSHQLLNVNAHVNQLQGGLNRLKVAIGGAFAVAGGVAILGTMGKMVEHGHELVKIQADMAQAGVKAADIQEATAKAWEMTAQNKNMSAVEVMKLINDGRMTFGSQRDATHHVDDFVQAQSFLKAYQGGKHAGHGEGLMREINAAMKSGELAGKISPAEMQEHVKQLVAMKVAYGEGVKVTDYLTAQRAGGVSLRNTKDEFRYGTFPALVQENGSGAGVMLMTAFNKIAAGTGNREKSLGLMRDIGLLEDGKYKNTKKGAELTSPDGIKGASAFAANPHKWVMEVFKPLVDKVTTDPIKQAQMISGMFPDRNAAKLLTEILQQSPKFEKDGRLMQEAYKKQDGKGYVDNSYGGQKQAFNAQVDNLQQILGGAMVGPATEALKKLNEALSGMAQWAKAAEHADKIKGIGIAIAGLGAALVGTGVTALVIAAGPVAAAVGGIIAGYSALAGALVAFKPQIMGAIEAISGVLTQIPAKVSAIAGVFVAEIGKIPEMVSGAISAAMTAIGNAIAGALKALNPFGGGGTPTVPGAKSGKTSNPGDDLPGLGKQGALKSAVPPPNAQATVVNTKINLDGRQIAASTVRHMGRASTNVASASGFDSRRGLASPDMQAG